MLTTEQKKIAKQIWEEIGKAERILLHFHMGADGDSVASNMAMAMVLVSLGKKVTVANGKEVPSNFEDYLDRKLIIDDEVETLVMESYDLHISLDSADWIMLSRNLDQLSQEFKSKRRINIDHHMTNTLFGDINLVITNRMSCAEVLLELFKIWKVKIKPEVADTLLLGLITDSGGFRYSAVNEETFRAAMELVGYGGNLQKANLAAFKSFKFELAKYWSTVLETMEFDKERNMVWGRLSYSVIQNFSEEILKYEETANVLLAMFENTDFGVFLFEKEEGVIGTSFRGRTGKVNVGRIAKSLGGGGHAMSAGCKLKNISLEDAKVRVWKAIDTELSKP